MYRIITCLRRKKYAVNLHNFLVEISGAAVRVVSVTFETRFSLLVCSFWLTTLNADWVATN